MSQLDMFAPPPSPSRPAPGPRLQSAARLHDIFFALRPDAAAARQLADRAAREADRLGVGGEPLEPGRLHVSLYLMASYERGDPFPHADVERWLLAASTVRMAPFQVAFDSLVTFGGKTNPLVLRSRVADGVAGVREFRREVGIALANAGEKLREKAFEPHMTVSYRGMRIADEPVDALSWAPYELVLIDSHLGERLHEVLGSWPLTA
jgi:2'-5' RNA ligase